MLHTHQALNVFLFFFFLILHFASLRTEFRRQREREPVIAINSSPVFVWKAIRFHGYNSQYILKYLCCILIRIWSGAESGFFLCCVFWCCLSNATHYNNNNNITSVSFKIQPNKPASLDEKKKKTDPMNKKPTRHTHTNHQQLASEKAQKNGTRKGQRGAERKSCGADWPGKMNIPRIYLILCGSFLNQVATANSNTSILCIPFTIVCYW